jgi:gamma-glutamylcyclotransferase (GGCT)/AIG2-like uncharacterized protein YtfP
LTASDRRADEWPTFVYGTLTDPDVLACVIGRKLFSHELGLRAWLDGFERAQALGASYPVLVPTPGAAVAGFLLTGLSPREVAGIDHFESGEYRAELYPVHAEDRRRREAWVYVGLPSLVATRARWDLAAWQQQHKSAFLAECEAWMADCPEPD